MNIKASVESVFINLNLVVIRVLINKYTFYNRRNYYKKFKSIKKNFMNCNNNKI